MGIRPHFPQQGEDVLIRSPFPNGFDDGHTPISGRNIQVPVFHGLRLPVSLPAHLGQGLLEFPVEIHAQADGLVEQDRHLPLGIGCGFFRPVAVSLCVLLIVPDPMLQQFDQFFVERQLGRGIFVVAAVVLMVVMAHGNLLSGFGS